MSLIPDEKGLLAIEQPTRGLDLNSTQSVWNKINERINDDICLFFSTTDIDEVWDQSDWIISFSGENITCLLYTSPSPRDRTRSRMPSSA